MEEAAMRLMVKHSSILVYQDLCLVFLSCHTFQRLGITRYKENTARRSSVIKLI